MASAFPGKSWQPSWNCSPLPPQIASLPLPYVISDAETRPASPSCIREVPGSNLSTTETLVLILYVRRCLWSRDAMVAE